MSGIGLDSLRSNLPPLSTIAAWYYSAAPAETPESCVVNTDYSLLIDCILFKLLKFSKDSRGFGVLGFWGFVGLCASLCACLCACVLVCL